MRILVILVWALCFRAAIAAPLQSTAEIRRLDAAELGAGLRVDIVGVVVGLPSSGPPNLQVWQDGTSIYVGVSVAERRGIPIAPAWRKIRPGDRVRVRGVASAGNFSPIVVPGEIVVLESAPLPAPRPVRVPDLVSGAVDGQWVSLSGVVQAARPPAPDGGEWKIRIASGDAVFTARVGGRRPEAWGPLIDSEVMVRGICLPQFNLRGEMTGMFLKMNGPGDLVVERPGSADPFAVPEVSPAVLRVFDPDSGTSAHRKLLRGVVTLVEPGSHLYLQGGERGVKVLLAADQSARVGERVEVSGFVEMSPDFAQLFNAMVRGLGPGERPEPLTLDPKSVPGKLSFRTIPPPPGVHCRLITLRGSLLAVESTPSGEYGLWIECKGDYFRASFPGPAPAFRPPRPGSLVEITGICELLMDRSGPTGTMGVPAGFRIHLRDASDLRVLQEASWWTRSRLWMLAGGAGAALALSLLYTTTLHRLVRKRSAELAGELVRRRSAEVRTEERSRLAEEIHDTMAQSLTGVALQLNAATIVRESAPSELPRHLRLATEVLDFARDEVRRTLRNLHSGLLDTMDLSASLQAVAGMLDVSGAGRITWESTGTPYRIDPLTAHALLRITQEALTNAVVHGEAGSIRVRLGYEPSAVTLRIEDDGKGCDPANLPGPAEGHLGIDGMRGRARRLGGRFRLSSQPGGDTIVEVSVPAAPHHPPEHEPAR